MNIIQEQASQHLKKGELLESFSSTLPRSHSPRTPNPSWQDVQVYGAGRRASSAEERASGSSTRSLKELQCSLDMSSVLNPSPEGRKGVAWVWVAPAEVTHTAHSCVHRAVWRVPVGRDCQRHRQDIPADEGVRTGWESAFYDLVYGGGGSEFCTDAETTRTCADRSATLPSADVDVEE